jgi:hypothetical protein
MVGGVIAPMLLSVAGEQAVEHRALRRDVELPGNLQLELVFAHRASVPAVVAG